MVLVFSFETSGNLKVCGEANSIVLSYILFACPCDLFYFNRVLFSAWVVGLGGF